MNLVSANVAVVWRFGSLYRDGLLQTATIRGCSMASRVSEPEPHITHSTTHSNCQHDRHTPGTVPFPNMSQSCCGVALIFVECIYPYHAHYLLSINTQCSWSFQQTDSQQHSQVCEVWWEKQLQKPNVYISPIFNALIGVTALKILKCNLVLWKLE